MTLLSPTTFALTSREKAQSAKDIISCLHRGASIINRRGSLSVPDCAEALSFLRDGLALAYDDDACDSSSSSSSSCRPAWAQLHLYLGHVARALKRSQVVEDAYAEAASTVSDDFSEQTAAREATANLLYIQKKRNADKRKGGVWDGHQLDPLPPSASRKSRGQRLREFLYDATAWNPEGDLDVQRMAPAAKQKLRLVSKPAARVVLPPYSPIGCDEARSASHRKRSYSHVDGRA